MKAWSKIGAHKTGDIHRPLVTFDHSWYRGKRGPSLEEIAPKFARHLYGKNVRVMMSSSLSEAEFAEVEKILNLARDAQPSGRAKGTGGAPGRKKCGSRSVDCR